MRYPDPFPDAWLLDWIVIHGSLVAGLALALAALERISGRRVWFELSTAGWWAVLLLWLPIPLPTLLDTFAVPRLSVPPPSRSAATAASISTGASVAAIAWAAGWLLLQLTSIARAVRARRTFLRERRASCTLRAAVLAASHEVGLRAPSVRVSTRVQMPAVLGVWRPLLILPAGFEHEAADCRHHVLLHELMHLRRHDPVKSWLAFQIQLLGWFHPALWWANRRLRSLREIGCDADVAGFLCGADGYRRTLIAFARRSLELEGMPPGIAFGEWDLRHRLERLGRSPRMSRSRRRLIAGALGFTSWLLLAPRLPIEDGDPAPFSTERTVLVEPDSTPDRFAARSPEGPGSTRPPGCLRLRYQVLGALAARADASGPARR